MCSLAVRRGDRMQLPAIGDQGLYRRKVWSQIETVSWKVTVVLGISIFFVASSSQVVAGGGGGR